MYHSRGRGLPYFFMKREFYNRSVSRWQQDVFCSGKLPRVFCSFKYINWNCDKIVKLFFATLYFQINVILHSENLKWIYDGWMNGWWDYDEIMMKIMMNDEMNCKDKYIAMWNKNLTYKNI